MGRSLFKIIMNHVILNVAKRSEESQSINRRMRFFASLRMTAAFSFLSILLASASPAHAAGIDVPSSSTLAITTGTIETGGDLTIAGTLSATTGTIKCSGNWTNTGTFTSGTGSVVFNGTNQTFSGSTSFYSFYKTVSADYTLTFDNTATITASNSLILVGSGATLSLKSDKLATQNNLTLSAGGTQFISGVDVLDSDASGGTTLVAMGNSIDSGNNLNWSFTGFSTTAAKMSVLYDDTVTDTFNVRVWVEKGGTAVELTASHSATLKIINGSGSVDTGCGGNCTGLSMTRTDSTTPHDYFEYTSWTPSDLDDSYWLFVSVSYA